jgi:hypothetical protein
MDGMDKVVVQHVSHQDNARANLLAQQVSGYDIQRGKFEVKRRPASRDMLAIHGNDGESVAEDVAPGVGHWGQVLIECISEPNCIRDRKVRRQVVRYTFLNGKLYRRTIDGLLLQCLSEEEVKVAMGEVHEGMCGSHQGANKMRWMLR